MADFKTLITQRLDSLSNEQLYDLFKQVKKQTKGTSKKRLAIYPSILFYTPDNFYVAYYDFNQGQ
jgi:hypothetical protein